MKKFNFNKFINKLEPVSKDELYELQLLSANAKSKKLYIFEKWSLNDIIWEEKAEELRKIFLKNNIKTKQITNISKLPEFSKDNDFVNKLIHFRYIPKEIFEIKYEMLIFDNIVAIYDSKKLLIIEDNKIANMQKQLFKNIWEQWQIPNLDFEYIPNHSYYKPIELIINNIPVIVYPDFNAGEYYKSFNKEKLKKYIQNILQNNSKRHKDTSYIIAFIWWFDWNKVIDMWDFTENFVDDKSWPLWDVIIYKEWKPCKNLSSSSWSTLLILWAEEKLRRQSSDLKTFLNWDRPRLPLEVCNWLDFFE